MVHWPGIIKHSDDAELIYVCDQAEWDNDADLHCFEYDETDYLIDSSGEIYSLINRQNKHVTPKSRSEFMTLLDILGLIKAHAAQKGTCCVAKLYAPTINEASKMVELLKET